MISASTTVFDSDSGFQATISTDQQQLNLATWATGQGWDGVAPAEITINSGVYVWSNNTSVPGMTTGNFPNGLILYVNGYIIGKGGVGASFPTTDAPVDATSGGPALSLGCDITIFGGSNGYIGGGGGGGGCSVSIKAYNSAGGGGAGGGSGGDGSTSSSILGGAGGTIGNTGSNGAVTSGGSAAIAGQGGGAGGGGAAERQSDSSYARSGGGGGRILPGVGGAGGVDDIALGGDGGSAGANGENGNGSAGGGGGWGANGGDGDPDVSYGAGASGGNAVVLNGNAVTWQGEFATDFANHIYGAVS